jgi:hypothetical protein
MRCGAKNASRMYMPLQQPVAYEVHGLRASMVLRLGVPAGAQDLRALKGRLI